MRYVVALLLLGSLLAQSNQGPAAELPMVRLPSAGATAVLPVPTIELAPPQKGGFTAEAAAGAFAQIRDPGRLAIRGARESVLFDRVAPGVVYVVAGDSLGAGVLVDWNGLIVTSWHLVGQFAEVGVIFYPGDGRLVDETRTVRAVLVMTDPLADLALLKISGDLPSAARPLELGNLSGLRVGADVHAIGHPEGYSWTYTKGFVSQIRPDEEWHEPDGTFHRATIIQTQTPTNGGSSGGPLFDDGGRLIGVIAYSYANRDGLHFAVSVDHVRALISRGSGHLGQNLPRSSRTCEKQIVFAGRTEADDASMHTYDLNCDGKEDMALVDYDDPSAPLRLFLDMDASGYPSGEVLDNDRDGRWDISYWDVDRDGKTDVVGFHPDGRPEPTYYGPYRS
jgi:S1-C subfamily serine protease